MDCSTPDFLVFQYLPSLLKFMSIELVMTSNHLILCHPLTLLPSIFPTIRVFSWINSSHQVAKVLELQHQSFQWLFRVDSLWDWLIWSFLCWRDSQDSSPDRRSQDGGGIGQGDHILFYKFIERTTERWTKSTKQLLIASSRHQGPRKVAHCLRREGKNFFFFFLFFSFFFVFLLFFLFSFLSFVLLVFLSYFLLKSSNTPLLFLNFHFHLNITLQKGRKKKEET